MSDYLIFWLSQFASQVIFFGTLLVIIFAFFIVTALPGYIKQIRCKHDTYRETTACDAVCTDCGKNLGFIQKLRDRDRARRGKQP